MDELDKTLTSTVGPKLIGSDIHLYCLATGGKVYFTTKNANSPFLRSFLLKFGSFFTHKHLIL